jgi:hypothetical protein
MRIDAGRVRVPVAGRAGIPVDARAAAIRVTGYGIGEAGAVTLVPADDGADEAAIGVGPASSAMCFVLLGAGAVDVLHTATTTSLTVDVVGWFEPVASATSSGRIVAIEPATIADTVSSARPFAVGETRRVTPAGACPPDASAVVVQLIAATDGRGAGWSVHPSGGVDDRPAPATGGATVATVVPLVDGGFDVTSHDGGHLSIEVVAYATGESAPASIDGLYVPTPPRRLVDTRRDRQPIPDGSSREIVIAPDDSGSVAINVTAISVNGTGTTSMWAAGARPPAGGSRVSQRASDAATSNLSVTPIGRRGIAIGSSGGDVHVVADVYGWFVGARSTDQVPALGSQPYGIQAIDMESYADEWLDYGISSDGRPLRAFRHGSGERIGLITTGLHGDEHTGTSVLADLITHDAIPGWTLWLVPIANPDARAANLRFVHDVDMNRDFPVDWAALPGPTASGCVTTRTGPVPHSLAESRQLAAAMIDGPFRGATVSVSHHDNYNWVAPQAGSPAVLRELADAYADATGLRRPGQNGSTVPTSPRVTHVKGGFETFADSLGMSSFLVENKAGYRGESWCAGSFGWQPAPEDVAVHHGALRALLTDGRLPT